MECIDWRQLRKRDLSILVDRRKTKSCQCNIAVRKANVIVGNIKLCIYSKDKVVLV